MFWIQGEARGKLEEIDQASGTSSSRVISMVGGGKPFGGDLDKNQALFGPELLHHIERADQKIRSTYYTRSYL